MAEETIVLECFRLLREGRPTRTTPTPQPRGECLRPFLIAARSTSERLVATLVDVGRTTLLTRAELVALSIIGAAVYLPYLVIHALCIGGTGWEIAGVEAFAIVPIIALFIALVAVPGLVFQRSRRTARGIVLIAGALFLLFIPTTMLAEWLRMLGFDLAARRAEPLVAAIRAYEHDHATPPPSFQALIPTYIPELPSRLPPLVLLAINDEESYYGNRWVLEADVGTGFLNWDKFVFLPNQNYPERDESGWYERIRDWAYYHE